MEKKQIYHSVKLEKDRCVGCTTCLKRCPMECIRVRNGKASILYELCIDCGVCVRICPHNAKVAQTDPINAIFRYKHRIALPAPTLYGQFRNIASVDHVLNALAPRQAGRFQVSTTVIKMIPLALMAAWAPPKG